MNEPLDLSMGHRLRSETEAIAEAVVACEFNRHPDLLRRFGPGARARSREDAIGHLLHLADAIDTHSRAVFDDHVAWAKVLLQASGMQAADLDHRLRCVADVLRERQPDIAAAADPTIEGARAALPAMPDTSATLLDPAQRLAGLARDYMLALLGGYRQAAGRLVSDAADGGEPVERLYLGVFQPALREVGRLWQLQKISVAQEHFCSAATQMLMSRLLPRGLADGRRGRTALIVCVRGEGHEIGARMIGDFLEMDGWDAYFCGADMPHAAVLQALTDRAADLLAISTATGCRLHAVSELVERVRADARGASLPIMVGGHPFTLDPALWRTVGADGTAADAEAAVALAGALCTPAHERAEPD